jgi:hypothetical protein
MPLSNDLAALIGFACEAVLWGAYSILFIVSSIILARRRNENLGNPVVYLNVLIFLSCTTHFALEFNHFHTTLGATGLVNGYANETSQLMGADFLISWTDLLGDLILIYRCWMVWGNNYYVIVLPLLSSIAGFCCMISVLDILLVVNPTAPTPPNEVFSLGLAAYVLPLCTNVIVTSLIVYRIWSTSRTVPGAPQIGQGVTRRAIMLIIESGAVYLVVQLVFVVLYATKNSAEAILAVIAVQTYGIAPTLIIMRVGMGISSENPSNTMTSTRIRWVARRGDDTGTSATRFTDVLPADIDMEGMHESDLTHPLGHDEKDLKDAEFAPRSSPV